MKKLALIIGNGKYDDLEELKNPENDANSIDEVLKDLGIDTIKLINIGVADFKTQLDEYKLRLNDYEVAFFFYAGHGLQIEGENFLCATDTDFSNENRVKYSSISINYLIDVMNKSSVYTKIIILDACRDNPFSQQGRSNSMRGLAPIHAPIGTIIAFATSPGQIAKDGTGNNGAYTSSLLKHIRTKDLKIEELFKRARHTLFSLTNGKQISWEHTSLMGDFYFCSSKLTGDFSSNYSDSAFCDSNYDYTRTTKAVLLINKLRSHDWNKQNSAIDKINATDFSDSSIDDLFVLGRNIYQTSCSTSWSADEYMKNLKTNLLFMQSEVRFHILNGMAFEIYFNNIGKLRQEFKIGRINEIVNLLMDVEFKQSGSYIISILSQYDFRYIFDFYHDSTLSIDVICSQVDGNVYTVARIDINGINKLFNHDGTNFYEIDEEIILYTRERIQKDVCEKIAAPESKVIFSYMGVPDGVSKIGFPYEYQLLNYQFNSDI